MAKKPRFKSSITRIKLNPEQAVLQCSCMHNRIYDPHGQYRVEFGDVPGIQIWMCTVPYSKDYRIELIRNHPRYNLSTTNS